VFQQDEHDINRTLTTLVNVHPTGWIFHEERLDGLDPNCQLAFRYRARVAIDAPSRLG